MLQSCVSCVWSFAELSALQSFFWLCIAMCFELCRASCFESCVAMCSAVLRGSCFESCVAMCVSEL
jgi:hypothetical protein